MADTDHLQSPWMPPFPDQFQRQPGSFGQMREILMGIMERIGVIERCSISWLMNQWSKISGMRRLEEGSIEHARGFEHLLDFQQAPCNVIHEQMGENRLCQAEIERRFEPGECEVFVDKKPGFFVQQPISLQLQLARLDERGVYVEAAIMAGL